MSPELTKLDQAPFHDVLFHPRQEKRTPSPPDSVDLDISLPEGSLLGCRLHKAGISAPLLVFFHGNGETVGDYDEVGRYFTDVGLSLACISYRGYGWSSGEPKASHLFDDAAVAFKNIREWCDQHGFSGPLFLMGRSLGSACAIDLAYHFPEFVKGLIIESGFADTLPLLASLGCAWEDQELTEEDCFGNRQKIASIKVPTLILHGAQDRHIPLAEAEKLQSESGARSKQFQVVPGADHNSLLEVAGKRYFVAIKQFVDSATGANTWREKRKRFRKEKSQ